TTDFSRKLGFLDLVPEDIVHDLEVFCDPISRPTATEAITFPRTKIDCDQVCHTAAATARPAHVAVPFLPTQLYAWT
ncbi:hypothetical protein STEG23_014061, partial [Scotinomys teguina]